MCELRKITTHMLSLEFIADEVTSGNNEAQAIQAVDLINDVLQRQPYGLGAQLLGGMDSLEFEAEKDYEERSLSADTGGPHSGEENDRTITKPIFAGEIEVKDPVEHCLVNLSVYRDPVSGGMFAVDSSFIEQDIERRIPSPFNEGYYFDVAEM